MHMCQRLHRLFPEKEEYMAEVEKSLFNIAFANQEGGEGIRYFAFMEEKKQKPGLVHCCCGVGTRIFGSLPEYIYSVSQDTLCVNLYTPSEIDWNGITLVSEADVPYSSDVKLTIKMPEASSAKSFKLMLRIPSWAVAEKQAEAGTAEIKSGAAQSDTGAAQPDTGAAHSEAAVGMVKIYVNGKMAASGVPGSYVTVERSWQDGDCITYRLGMDFRLTKYSGADEIPGLSRYAIEYGPVLYALAGPDYKSARIPGWSIEDFRGRLVPTNEPLVYDIKEKNGYRLVPYMDIGCEEEFTCYPVFNV